MTTHRRNSNHPWLFTIMGHLLLGALIISTGEQMVQPVFAAPATEISANGASAAIPASGARFQHPAATTEKVGGAKVSIANFTFIPAEITIAPGETVTWTNDDGAPHGLEYQDGAKGTDLLLPGATFSRQFDRPGTYDYSCSVHPYMTGRVVVRTP